MTHGLAKSVLPRLRFLIEVVLIYSVVLASGVLECL